MCFLFLFFFFFKQKTAYEISACLVGSEMCIRDRVDEVIALFAQLEQFIRLEDLDDYLAACHELTARLEHIRRMELPTVENVM